MAKVTITFTDHPPEATGTAMDQTISIEVAGAEFSKAIDSPAILLGIGFRRLLDNEQYMNHLACAVGRNPGEFWKQLREITGIKKVEAANADR